MICKVIFIGGRIVYIEEDYYYNQILRVTKRESLLYLRFLCGFWW